MSSSEWAKWMEVTDQVLRSAERRLICPHCRSAAVEWLFVGGGLARLGYGAVWCNTCRHGVWLSRLAIPDTVPMVAIDADPTSVDIPRFKQATPSGVDE
jgi:hypothetical protein